MTRDRIITADASQVSGSDFLKALTGDPNDISQCEQAGGYFLRDGAWRIIRDHHVGVQFAEVHGDPFLNRRVA